MTNSVMGRERARMALSDASSIPGREHPLARAALVPFPHILLERFKLKDGTIVLIRPIRPDDEPAMVRFHQGLSDNTVYFRYFGPLKLEERVRHARLAKLCTADYIHQIALIAEHPQPESPEGGRIMGVGRLSRSDTPTAAEFGVVVNDQWQGLGLGTALLKKLIEIARAIKIEQLTALILPDNRAMLMLAQKQGFKISHLRGECRAFLTL